MANVDFYQNKLMSLVGNPGSFTGTPGYTFARDQALDALNRSNSGIRGSGAAMAALSDRAGNMAAQNYSGYLHDLGGLTGQEQQYDLGQNQNANAATRTANDFTLGQGQLALGNKTADQNFGLGMYRSGNDFTLGQQQNANAAQRNWNDFSLGNDRNSIDRASMENNYNLGQGAQGLGWYNAQTNRGTAQSQSALDWTKYNTSIHPVRRIAGQY